MIRTRASSTLNPNLIRAVAKLAIAGEHAGFALEEMIEFLNAGLPISSLLEMITARLRPLAKAEPCSRKVN
ncbi:MAG TPA: hypothetical protein VFA89_12295 [Terriglobales bacterium]|nr:hypothetical protein [Terriglobales bacterium]